MSAEDFGLRPRALVPVDAASDVETCDRFFDRLITLAKEQGQTDAEKKRNRWKKWISPVIGEKAISATARDDVEDVRDKPITRSTWTKDHSAASKISERESILRPRGATCLNDSLARGTESEVLREAVVGGLGGVVRCGSL